MDNQNNNQSADEDRRQFRKYVFLFVAVLILVPYIHYIWSPDKKNPFEKQEDFKNTTKGIDQCIENSNSTVVSKSSIRKQCIKKHSYRLNCAGILGLPNTKAAIYYSAGNCIFEPEIKNDFNTKL